jgi:hypothetical protein
MELFNVENTFNILSAWVCINDCYVIVVTKCRWYVLAIMNMGSTSHQRTLNLSLILRSRYP